MSKYVETVMSKQLITVEPGATIQEVVNLFSKYKIDSVPVVKGQALVGLFTKSSLFKAIAEEKSLNSPVENLMTKTVVTVTPNTTITEAWHISVGRLPVLDENNRLVGMLTRTDLVRAFHDEAKEASLKLQEILDSTTNGIVAINNDGIITLFNQAAAKLTGYHNNALGLHINQIIPNTGLLETLKNQQCSHSQKLELRNGVVASNRSPIFRNKVLVGAVGVFQDISLLENISSELKTVKSLYRELDMIIETIHDALAIVNADGKLERVNSSYERISGIKGRDIVGRNMKDLEEEGIVSESISLKVLQKKRPLTIVQRLKTGREILFTGVPLFNEGKIEKVISTGRDMTELNGLKVELEREKVLRGLYQSELSQFKKDQPIIFSSTKMTGVMEIALKVAEVDSTVLLLGESGVGKEVITRVIHNHSRRMDKPMIKINSAAIPENLLESELFGYVEGAFTGAKKGGKPGLFELAHGGTLFLDEVGDLPLGLQAKLLRVLQEKEITRVGDQRTQKVDVRIIAATNRNLKNLVSEGRFREDLFYRLNVVPITIPSLKERKEDILPLVFQFLKKFNEKYSLKKSISASLLEKLIDYDWPGNVRELENIIERMVVISYSQELTEKDLPFSLPEDKVAKEAIVVTRIIPLKEAVRIVERELIGKAITQFQGVRAAAKALEVDPATVVRKRDQLLR